MLKILLFLKKVTLGDGVIRKMLDMCCVILYVLYEVPYKIFIKVIIKPNSPSMGVIVAFIEDNGAPIEFLQLDRSVAEEGF